MMQKGKKSAGSYFNAGNLNDNAMQNVRKVNS